ncbi:MAG TPA: phenylalanine--tRNA ligase subunit alpha [Thermoanaerobaculia bacterium]|jgi:phenylalanyl-tRNA synthetase alpha chain|nr:phenylalanine--tRNA ligase subunit alpha [Thermoanaerobaculia bacterium]
MADLLQDLEDLKREAGAALAAADRREPLAAWHGEYLGRRGRLAQLMRRLAEAPAAERATLGRAANEVKRELEESYAARQEGVRQRELEAALEAERVDVTLPGRPADVGGLHPITRVLRDVGGIFGRMGFQIFDGPEVETDEYNFGLLNMPAGHPARDMWDTFYTTIPNLILRTHTSPGQIYAMRSQAPGPLRVILPGKTYRYEQVTARSESMFHQVEGIAVGEHVSFGDLKGVVVGFAEQMFGAGRRLRFRKSYFPFTEPSVEVDVSCILCGGGGCYLCKQTGWLEIMGAGMVHPRVLRAGGYDPGEVSGFAFGMGPERIAMLKYGIADIRYFFSNDVRLLESIRY